MGDSTGNKMKTFLPGDMIRYVGRWKHDYTTIMPDPLSANITTTRNYANDLLTSEISIVICRHEYTGNLFIMNSRLVLGWIEPTRMIRVHE